MSVPRKNGLPNFESGNMSVEDDYVGEAQPAVGNDLLKQVIEQNPRTAVKDSCGRNFALQS